MFGTRSTKHSGAGAKAPSPIQPVPSGSRAGAGQIRIAALVIPAAMLFWMGGSWIGGQLGWPSRYAFLIDFVALAAFAWSLIVLVGVWRQRRSDEA